mmetsp:Transcript_31669/g.66140  ORF Transcript_31669/g.66140 Transcript_31669/m.66140 type:complete len:89 (+) Transcript_31669:933-1199(+)
MCKYQKNECTDLFLRAILISHFPAYFAIVHFSGNKVVLAPAFNDPHDSVAASILQSVYPDRKVVSINVVQLYQDGGLIHCVTQQQPAA